MYEHVIKYFDKPDEVREFPKGRFELVTVRGFTVGRATYQPGWKWSEHIAPIAKVPLCEVEHLGVVLSGQAVAAYADGTQIELRAGSVFYIPGVPHDSWVVGNQPYVSLHLQGAEHYSK
jgi:quercetin dioxygenase-like cupin family protein